MGFSKLPYLSLSDYLKEKFGGKVKKVSLDAGFSCPNRTKNERKGGCFWCDAYGSGPENQGRDWFERLESETKRLVGKNCKGVIAYFQAFTNTFGDPEKLEEIYKKSLSIDGVVGIAIGTRPDCLDDDVLKILDELNKKTFLWVEIGMQSRHNQTLKLCNRRHSHEDTVVAVEKLKERKTLTVLHLIAGLPEESEEMIIESFKECARLKPWGVKLHPLHIVKGSVFEEWFKEGKIKLLSFDEYVNLAVQFLKIVPPETIIHRITGERAEGILIAPKWCLDKNRVRNEIFRKLVQN